MLVRCALTVLVVGCAAAQTPATSVVIGRPTAVAADVAGNLYFAATHDCRATVAAALFKLDAGGGLTRGAGNGSAAQRPQITEEYPPAPGQAGSAISAQLLTPVALALDAAGNLDIADGLGRPGRQSIARGDHHLSGRRRGTSRVQAG
jgi:hypothetical protein